MAVPGCTETPLETKLKQLEEQFRHLFRDVLAKKDVADGSSLRIDVHLTKPDPNTALATFESRQLFSEDIKIAALAEPQKFQYPQVERVEADHGENELRPYDRERSLPQPVLVPANEVTPVARGHDETEDHAEEESNDESPDLIPGSRSRYSHSRAAKRHKAIGGLRLPPPGTKTPQNEPQTVRHMQSDTRYFSKRKTAPEDDRPPLRPTSLDRLVEGIWERIHGGSSFDISQLNGQGKLTEHASDVAGLSAPSELSFRKMSVLCRDITCASQTCRAIELIVQARWIDYFNVRMQDLTADREVKNMKLAIVEASQDFGWSEKYLRNRMAVWHGYHQIKEAGGWAALVFSGAGIYRFCKYRVGFDTESIQALRNLRDRFEVAADTLHPKWRELLTIVGESPIPRFTGHPLDWVVKPHNSLREISNRCPVPLSETYVQWDVNFSYRHIETCEIEQEVWGDIEPRQSYSMLRSGQFFCIVCDKPQSEDSKVRECNCFPEIFGGCKTPFPVQVFQTSDGRNNGLLACCEFPRGSAIGEYVGLVTAGLKDLDIMEGTVEDRTYQIWQGREGNHTRFANHSCRPNSQFQKFFWLGVERVLLVSKGVEAGEEITVDYADSYWRHLEKVCLCGSSACRYQNRDGAR